MLPPPVASWLLVVEQTASRVAFRDPDTGELGASIDVGFWPHEIEVSPDNKTAYVSNFGLQDYDETLGVPGYSISILDLELQCERGRIYTVNPAGGVYSAPHGVKLRPGTAELFVNVERGGRILVYDTKTRELKRALTGVRAPPAEVPLARQFADPEHTHNFIFSADGTALFILAGPCGAYKMDPDTGQILARYCQPNVSVHGLAFLPDLPDKPLPPGEQSLIASADGKILLLDPADLTVRRVLDNLGVGQILYSAPTPDGTLIVAPAVWDSQVIVIDVKTGTVVRRIVTGIDPVHVEMAPDGLTAWVANARSHHVSRIDLNSWTHTRLEIGDGPNGLALCPRVPLASRQTLVFGAVVPLSGALGQSGRELAAGYQYWAEHVNGSGGLAVGSTVYDVRVDFRDNASDPTQTVALTNDLLDNAAVQFMFGGYPTPSDAAVGPLLNEDQIPMVTSACSGDVIYTSQNKYVFGVLSPAAGYLKGSIDVMNGLSPSGTLSILSSDDPAAMEDAKANLAHALSLDMSVLYPFSLPPGFSVTPEGVIAYHEGTTDFTPVLQRIAEQRPKVFLVTGHAPATLAIVQQASAINFTPSGLSFAVGPATPSVVQKAGSLAENLFGPAQWIPQIGATGCDRFGTSEQFAADYYQRYNLTASYLSAGAVACGLVFEDAIQRAGSLDRVSVRNALADTHLETFYALIEFNDRGINENKPLYTMQLQQLAEGMTNVVYAPRRLPGSPAPVWPFPGWKVPAIAPLSCVAVTSPLNEKANA